MREDYRRAIRARLGPPDLARMGSHDGVSPLGHGARPRQSERAPRLRAGG